MTTKILSGTYTAAYYLSAPITTLSITASGVLEQGLTATAPGTYTLFNRGEVSGDKTAISLAGAGFITNAGTILGTSSGRSHEAIYLGSGGAVTNDIGAMISGYYGGVVAEAAASVRNLGVVMATSNAGGSGIELIGGGAAINGSADDTTATVTAYFIGIGVAGPVATVKNFGTVSSHFWGVYESGGLVINGSTGDTAALIQSKGGISFNSAYGNACTVVNFGTIDGSPEFGILMNHGGRVTNGSADDTSARIVGDVAVVIEGGEARVTNFGTIGDATDAVGVYFLSGGSVTNGSAGDTTALIRGGSGAGGANAPVTVANFGTVLSDKFAIVLYDGGRVVNGGTSDTVALVEGYFGVYGKAAPVTLTNFATIVGDGGTAVNLTAGGRINAEAGSVFEGTVAAGSAVVDAVGGTTSMTALTTAGVVNGAGTIALTGGASVFASGASLSVARLASTGGTVEIAGKLADARGWSQSGTALTVDSGGQMTFTGMGDAFAGTLTGAGKLVFGGGSDALTDVTLAAASMTVNGAAVTLAGTIDLAGPLAVTSSSFAIAGAGATLAGGGALNLSDVSTNHIRAVAAGAVLTNADRITGAGQIGGGGLALVNAVGGVIAGNQASALVINTGTAVVANSGLIENVGAGGTTITGAVANSGTLLVNTGTLTVDGQVTGAGIVKIAGGVARFVAAGLAEAIAFTGASGVLELTHSQSFAGQVSGFSRTGSESLDLVDIPFGVATKASYSGTTAGGVLTVTNGAHTATISLIGNYTASTFTLASDAHGGTAVTDPAALSQAMSAFGAHAGAISEAPPFHLTRPALLVAGSHARQTSLA